MEKGRPEALSTARDLLCFVATIGGGAALGRRPAPMMPEGPRPRQALTAASCSTPSRRAAESRSPRQAMAMTRFARNSLSSWPAPSASLLQTSSRAIDIALMSAGPNTPPWENGMTVIVFLSTHKGVWRQVLSHSPTLPEAGSLQRTSMFLPSSPAVEPKVGPNPYKRGFVMILNCSL